VKLPKFFTRPSTSTAQSWSSFLIIGNAPLFHPGKLARQGGKAKGEKGSIWLRWQ
jgi:hypothetical protein